MEPNAIYSLDEAARALHATPDTIAQYARTGELCGTLIGKGWIFTGQKLLDFVNTQSAQEAAERRRLHSAGPVLQAVADPTGPRSRRGKVLPPLPGATLDPKPNAQKA
jgi:hypothetical protein